MDKRTKHLNQQGKRLTECRDLRGLSREALLEKIDYQDIKSLKDVEYGKRPYSSELLDRVSQALNINADYLQCKTDLLSDYEGNPINLKELFPTIKLEDGTQSILLENEKQIKKYEKINRATSNINLTALPKDDTYQVIDSCLIRILELLNIHLTFKVLGIFDTENKYYSLTFDSLNNFSLSNPCCYTIIDDVKKEIVITSVIINDSTEMSFGVFKYTINRIYDYIQFTFEHIKDFQEDYKICDANNSIIKELIPINEETQKARKKFLEKHPDFKF